MFGLVKELLSVPSDRTRLKIIIMSATLDHEKFSDFFNNCPVFEIPGRLYPVDKIYCNYIKIKDLKTPSYLAKVRKPPHD